MAVTIPLEQMATAEKLLVMENIWDNLCRRADEISSPPWHKKVLQQKEEKVKNGIEEFADWERDFFDHFGIYLNRIFFSQGLGKHLKSRGDFKMRIAGNYHSSPHSP